MSLPWNKSIWLRIELHGVMATLRKGWPTPVTVATAHEWVEESSELSAHPGYPDTASQLLPIKQIEAVFETLRQSGELRGARLTVEISDALVLLDVIEGDLFDNTDRQFDAIAAACVNELLGEQAAEHEIRWQLQDDDHHLLMCAMPRSYLSELTRIAHSFDVRLVSVEPDFVRQWNQHSQVLASGMGVFAVATRAHVAVAWACKGVISALSTGPLGSTSTADSSQDATFSELVEGERVQRVEQLTKKMDSMMSEFGLATRPGRLDGPATKPFDKPQPVSVSALDRRVDRLLAGMGQEASAQTAFVLVTSDPTRVAVSDRWRVHRDDSKIRMVTAS